jgi:putative membrane protein
MCSLHVLPFDFWNWGWSEPWGWFSAILSLLITVIIISVFVRIILRIVRGDRYYCHHNHHHGHWDDFAGQDDQSGAKKILDERYAKGEISEEEYKKMRENLK